MSDTNKIEIHKEAKLEIQKEYNNVEEVINDLKEKLKYMPQINSEDEIPSSLEFKDMDKALYLFADAVANNKKIIFIHDSDMDGLGTYTIAWFFFKNFFKYDNLELYITNRKEGYGFLPLHVDKYPGDLYITADNGITAKPAIQAAVQHGANVIITDHHQIDPDQWPLWEEEYKDKVAVVDPWRPDDEFPYKDITGTAVFWFFLKGIAERYQLKADMYHEFLPELAITTISDVMPIDRHLSRFFVKDFLENQKYLRTNRQYFKTYLQYKNQEPNAEDLAFTFVPPMNATQRITKADDGANFLIQEDSEMSSKWMEYINKLNDIRKERQQKLLDYIEKTFYQDYIKDKKFIMIPGKFHKEYSGVLGIIAGRLAEKYRAPTIVLNYNEDSKSYSGSGRSVGSINILDIFRNEKIQDMITHVGGHTAALGIGIKEEYLDEFHKIILEEVQKIPEEDFLPIIRSTGYVDIKKLDIDWYWKLKELEPFGHQFPRPTFTSKVIIKKVNIIGKQKNHCTMVVTDSTGSLEFKALWFFHDFEPQIGKEYEIVYQPDLDSYRGQEKLALRVIKVLD